MRVVIQRVTEASVAIDGKLLSSIKKGLLILLGVEENDLQEDAVELSGKISRLRIFDDNDGVMNLSVKEIEGEVLVVSQFTLHASTKKGNRPSYIRAARPEKAIPLYEKFIAETEGLLGKPCKTGSFGANMQIELVNDGPVTIVMDSKNR